MTRRTVEEILDRAKGAPSDCWIWPGKKQVKRGGYGMLYRDGKEIRAHRFFYEQLVGPIPEGLVLDHLCRVPACVNPAHLEPVTNRENILRGTAPSAQHARKTHCYLGHSLHDAVLTPVAGGIRRDCRTCRTMKTRRYYEARKPIPADSPFVCDDCGRRCANGTGLAAHKRSCLRSERVA